MEGMTVRRERCACRRTPSEAELGVLVFENGGDHFDEIAVEFVQDERLNAGAWKGGDASDRRVSPISPDTGMSFHSDRSQSLAAAEAASDPRGSPAIAGENDTPPVTSLPTPEDDRASLLFREPDAGVRATRLGTPVVGHARLEGRARRCAWPARRAARTGPGGTRIRHGLPTAVIS